MTKTIPIKKSSNKDKDVTIIEVCNTPDVNYGQFYIKNWWTSTMHEAAPLYIKGCSFLLSLFRLASSYKQEHNITIKCLNLY